MDLRPTVSSDLPTIAEWIEADNDHRGMDPNFWIIPGVENFESFVVENPKPVFAVRVEKVMRIHIQFGPRSRNMIVAIDEFTAQIKSAARRQGFSQIIFESTSEPLIRFLEKRGFRKSQNEVLIDL
jgi:hypothetical protein